MVIISSELVQVEVVQVWDNEVQVRKKDGSMSWRSIHNVAPFDPRLGVERSDNKEAAAGSVELQFPSPPPSKKSRRAVKSRADAKRKKRR